MTLKECYEILGLAKTAKLEDVKRAYRKRAFELHPDLNPNLVDASRQFQLLNEAYVNLMRVLSAREEAAGNAEAQQQAQTRKPPSDKAKADSAGTADASAGSSRQQAEKPEGGNAAGASEASQSATQSTGDKRRKAADEAYARQEEVLRDILNDQFARRVFEDIYSEVSKKQVRPEERAQARQEPRPEPRRTHHDATTDTPRTPPKAKKSDPEGEEKTFLADLTTGVGDVMRSWLRHQIDDELTVGLPKAKLFPGARVRLQIRQGLSKEPRVVELTLPPDFRPGKPLRLKGMGKKVGKWIGDLYLVIEAQQ